MSASTAGRRLASAAGHAAVGLLLLGGLAATSGYFYLRSSLQRPSGSVELASPAAPRAPVRIRVDEWGVPRVRAESLPDALFAEGFLHAGHRLWQMELLRRSARGRLADAFGERALPVDRLSRTLGLWRAAGRALRGLDAGERALLEAYAAGVNARLESWEGAWPPEFVLLGIEPGRWSPRASLALGKLMALDLTSWETELSRWHASRTLPAEKYRFLRAGYPGWGPTILRDSVALPPGVSAVSGEGVPEGPGPAASERGRAGGGGTGRAEPWDPLAFLAALSARHASNAWVAGGARTESGRPVLANDMHLALRAPSTWYLASLSAGEEVAVAGLTLPGVPGVVVGFNRDVAWGFTNGMVDDIDFSVERPGPRGRRHRDGEGDPVPFAVRPETIRVRGRREPAVHRVRSTERGPVISDALEGIDLPISARWVPAETAGELRGLIGMNRAASADAFGRAVAAFSSPHQNVVFADGAGNLGYRLAGRIPVRPGSWSGALPVPASRWDGGWRGYWPPDAHPAGRNPESGFYAAANNLQAPGLHGVVGRDYPLPLRARRLVDRLAAEDSWTPRDAYGLARDTRSLLADRVGSRAVRAARRAGEGEAARTLAAWDHRVAVESRGAALFYAWFYALRDRVAADEYGGGGRWSYFPDGALLRLLEGASGGGWVDDVGTPREESLAGLEEEAMRDAVVAVGGRGWGALHREVHRHPLGRTGWLDALFGFDVGPYPGPGAPHTLRPDDYGRWGAVGGGAWRPPWISDYGPTERFVAEFGPDGSPRGRFLLPTGQGGNPFGRHYRDMTARWRGGRPIRVRLPGRDPTPSAAARSYVLRPSGAPGGGAGGPPREARGAETRSR